RVVGVPPFEKAPRIVDGEGKQREPRQAQARLIREFGSRPLRRHPLAADHDGEHDQNLANENLGRSHRCLRSRTRNASWIGDKETTQASNRQSPLNTLYYDSA